jgi:hypothetical protein
MLMGGDLKKLVAALENPKRSPMEYIAATQFAKMAGVDSLFDMNIEQELLKDPKAAPLMAKYKQGLELTAQEKAQLNVQMGQIEVQRQNLNLQRNQLLETILQNRESAQMAKIKLALAAQGKYTFDSKDLNEAATIYARAMETIEKAEDGLVRTAAQGLAAKYGQILGLQVPKDWASPAEHPVEAVTGYKVNQGWTPPAAQPPAQQPPPMVGPINLRDSTPINPMMQQMQAQRRRDLEEQLAGLRLIAQTVPSPAIQARIKALEVQLQQTAAPGQVPIVAQPQFAPPSPIDYNSSPFSWSTRR